MGGIFSGIVGVYLLNDLGHVNLHIKPTLLVANILGGAAYDTHHTRPPPPGLIVDSSGE